MVIVMVIQDRAVCYCGPAGGYALLHDGSIAKLSSLILRWDGVLTCSSLLVRLWSWLSLAEDQNFRQEFISSLFFQFPWKSAYFMCALRIFFWNRFLQFVDSVVSFAASNPIVQCSSKLKSSPLCSQKIWRFNWNLCLYYSLDEQYTNKCL